MGRGPPRLVARHFGHSFGAYAIGDDLPQPGNRVTLSRTDADSDGLPAARLHYQPHENDLRMMRYGMDRCVTWPAA